MPASDGRDDGRGHGPGPREAWTHAELFEGLDVAPSFVADCVRLGLLRVVARDAAGAALYGPESRDQLTQVLSLVQLGYAPKDIAAIQRRVGLPGAKSRGLFRRPPKRLRADQVASRAGVSVDCFAGWVAEGLIAIDLRSEGGEALFAPEAVRLARRLDDLRELGLADDEVSAWGRLAGALEEGGRGRRGDDGPRLPDGVTPEEARERIGRLDERLKELRAAVRRWDKLVTVYGKRVQRLARVRDGATGAETPRAGLDPDTAPMRSAAIEGSGPPNKAVEGGRSRPRFRTRKRVRTRAERSRNEPTEP